MQAEKKSEQKRRGNKDTQTSDAKFDEQFKLGHQMAAQVCGAVVVHCLDLLSDCSTCCITMILTCCMTVNTLLKFNPPCPGAPPPAPSPAQPHLWEAALLSFLLS